MVRARVGIAILGVIATVVGAAPVATADPVAGDVGFCQVPPHPVVQQEIWPDGAEASGDSDVVWNAHVAYVEWALADAPTTEDLFRQADGTWEPNRSRQQNALMDEYWQLHHGDSVPRDGAAIIAGGVPGAGKTTVLKEQPAIGYQQYFVVNPDDVKEVMATRAMVPAIVGLSPMEASANAHEEASMLAKLLAERAYRQQTNVIWDITMSTEASVGDRISAMRDSGYLEINGVFVDTPLDIARVRVLQRWRQGQENYWAGEGLGGRYVPDDFIDMSRPDNPGFSSRNQEIFEAFRDQFSSTIEYDSSGPDPKVGCVTGPRWN